MRFFAHDGKAFHGPSALEELIRLPGFDGDTLVCPVGSENSADWKPALAYPPFREALLSPAPKLMPIAPPPAMPPAPTVECPRCGNPNPERARYCNACAARMDGREDPRPPAPEPVAAPVPLAAPAPMPLPVPEPELPPMAAPRPMGPMSRPAPMTPPPAAHSHPHVPASLAAPSFDTLDPLMMPPHEPAPSLVELEPVLLSGETRTAEAAVPAAAAPAAAAAPLWRKVLIASFAGAAVASGALGWWLMRPKPAAAPASPTLNMDMPAPSETPAPGAPTGAPTGVPAAATAAVPAPAAPAAAAPAPAAAAALPASPAPVAPAPVAARKHSRKPKTAPVDLNDLTRAPEETAAPKPAARKRRARKPKPAPAPAAAPADAPEDSGPAADETLIESRAVSSEPSMPGGTDAETAAPAEPAAAPPSHEEDRGFLLPGVPRRVPPSSVTKPKIKVGAAPPAKPGTAAAAVDAASAEAAASAPPAAQADAAAEDGTAKQVREQFVFCSQLLAQGAFADHFDTCLCAEARSAAPYRGRRGFYATAMKKADAAGTLATSAKVTGIVLDGPIAKVTAEWKSSAGQKARTETESWQLEDGLWCRYP